MKYIVMECHKGYAILMDEESRFIRSANLNYTVGQTVKNPVIMSEKPQSISIIQSRVVRIVAAAACMVLMSVAGLQYYNNNMKTQSVVTIDSTLQIEMALNSKGEVIHLYSKTNDGQEILNQYEQKNKDSISTANDIIKLEIEQGYISDGDTIELSVPDESPIDYKSVIEKELAKNSLNINIKNKDDINKPEPPEPHEVEKPAPPVEDDKPVPPTPPIDDDKPVPPAPPIDDDKPVPPAPPIDDDKPVPPAPPIDDDKPVPPTPPIDDDKPVPPTPPIENDKPISPIEEDKPVPPAPQHEENVPNIPSPPHEKQPEK